MTISKEEYERIMKAQDENELTIYIDTSTFRSILSHTADPKKLSETIGVQVTSKIHFIQFLTYLTGFCPLVTIILCPLALGWWGAIAGLLVIPAWFIYYGEASKGSQPGPMRFAVCIVLLSSIAAMLFNSQSIWIRSLIGSLGLTFFTVRYLYYYTAGFVFRTLAVSYEFFNLFYLQPKGAIVPLIWTSELDREFQSSR